MKSGSLLVLRLSRLFKGGIVMNIYGGGYLIKLPFFL
jgi:hypothetical protein